MWQQDMPDLNGDGQITPEDDNMPWCEALAYCENLSLAGHDDWRLPNVRELQSVVDYGRVGPASDPVFSAAHPHGYWSSTSNALIKDRAWRVEASTLGSSGNNQCFLPTATARIAFSTELPFAVQVETRGIQLLGAAAGLGYHQPNRKEPDRMTSEMKVLLMNCAPMPGFILVALGGSQIGRLLASHLFVDRSGLVFLRGPRPSPPPCR